MELWNEVSERLQQVISACLEPDMEREEDDEGEEGENFILVSKHQEEEGVGEGEDQLLDTQVRRGIFGSE